MGGFKVGDRVKCIDPVPSLLYKNDIYTVEEVAYESGNTFLNISKDGKGFEGWRASRFEKVDTNSFKVGDVVRSKERRLTGTIVEIRKRCYPYLVEHPGWKGGHDGTDCIIPKSEEKNRWWYRESEIELVEEHKGKIEEEIKMEKPETQLEKTACQKAKDDAIKAAIEKKARVYQQSVNEWLEQEQVARRYRKMADELKEALGLTEKEIKELL